MTTSTDRRDIDLAYQLGANCYIPKPLHFEKFKMVIALIHNYWFGIAAHPDVENAREL
jgi:two-component system response regulator